MIYIWLDILINYYVKFFLLCTFIHWLLKKGKWELYIEIISLTKSTIRQDILEFRDSL